MQASGQSVPALDNRPPLDAIDLWNLQACATLSGDRAESGALPWCAVAQYGAAMGLGVDEVRELHDVLAIGTKQLEEYHKAKRKQENKA